MKNQMSKYGILLDTSNLNTNRQFLIGYEELKEHGGILPQIMEKTETILNDTSNSGMPRYMIGFNTLIKAVMINDL